MAWPTDSWLVLWALPLVVLPLLLRWLPVPSDRDAPWNTAIDISMALGAGVVAGVVSAVWTSPHALGTVLTTHDFSGICDTIGSLRQLDPGGITKQPGSSLLPAALAAVLGVIEGLAVASLLTTMATGVALYCWGRILHSRSAGVAAACILCAIHPLAAMTRQLDFYPEQGLMMLLCAVTATAALRFPNLWGLGAAGVGIGLALMADHTGLSFGLAALAVTGLVALRAPLRKIPVRLVVLFAPIAVSYGLSSQMMVMSPFLEDRFACFVTDSTGVPENRFFGQRKRDDSHLVGSLRDYAVDARNGRRYGGYCWGHSSPLGLPRTLVALGVMSRDLSKAESPDRWQLPTSRRAHVYPWLPPAFMALLVIGLALRKRPLLLLGLLLVLAPFSSSLRLAASSQILAHVLITPLMPIPMLIGTAWAIMAFRTPSEPPTTRWTLLAPLLTALVLIPLMLGVPKTFLAPDAAWRQPLPSNVDAISLSIHSPRFLEDPTLPNVQEDDMGYCREALLEDLHAGHSPGTRLYPNALGDARKLIPVGTHTRHHAPTSPQGQPDLHRNPPPP